MNSDPSALSKAATAVHSEAMNACPLFNMEVQIHAK